jgi:hypothetical protein
MTAPVCSRRGRQRGQRALWTVLIGLLAGACRLAPAMGVEPRAERVVVVGIDGLSPEGIGLAATPVLDRLVRGGASSMQARAVLPTSSSPNWASMIMGAGPEQHGITSNKWQRNAVVIAPAARGPEGIFPTIFGAVRAARPAAAIGVFHDWKAFGRLVDGSSCTELARTDGPLDTVATGTRFLEASRPVLLFLHLDHVDHAGHAHGWNSPEYLRAVAEADRLVGDIVDRLAALELTTETLLLVTSDHGGIGKGHGGETMEELLIPWIASGAGVRPGHVIAEPIVQSDTAATIAFALGVPRPACWTGRPVRAAFRD